MKKFSAIIIILARFILGIVLVSASIGKISDPDLFAEAISNYQIIPYGLENSLAIVLPWLELLVGIGLIFGIFISGSAFLTILMMAVFIFAISFAILNGYNIECGCGLKPGEIIGINKIIEDSVYLILSIVVLRKKNRHLEFYPK